MALSNRTSKKIKEGLKGRLRSAEDELDEVKRHITKMPKELPPSRGRPVVPKIKLRG